MSCQNYSIPYDLTYVEGEPAKSSSILLNFVNWNHSDPNVITLNMTWKRESSCVGAYERRICTLTAATVEYPVEMSLDVAGKYRGPYFSLPVNTTWHNDKIIRELPVYDGESQDAKVTGVSPGWSTYGGIAFTFSKWYFANLTFAFNGSTGWSSNRDGPLANAVDAGFWNGGKSSIPCTVSMAWGLSYLDYFEEISKRDYRPSIEFGPMAYTTIGSPIDLVLNQVRQSMFLASVYQGAGYWSRSFASPSNVARDFKTFTRPANSDDYIQYVEALRTKTAPVYKIRWSLWAASVTMTFGVILIILPTFFGFCKYLLTDFSRGTIS